MSRRLAVLAGLISAGLVICGGSPALAATSAPSARLAPAVASPVPNRGSPVPGWGRAQPVPGTSSASGAALQGVSCAPGGTCTAIGDYDTTSASGKVPFAITGKNGVWGQAQPLPGLAAFAPQGAEPQALDCPASGDCLIAGSGRVLPAGTLGHARNRVCRHPDPRRLVRAGRLPRRHDQRGLLPVRRQLRRGRPRLRWRRGGRQPVPRDLGEGTAVAGRHRPEL